MYYVNDATQQSVLLYDYISFKQFYTIIQRIHGEQNTVG